ncbi:MAG: flagellar basal body P-ring formation chaperone FlgA [Acidiphilium sp.]|nr:flagellar basal body P-ring formation chaperone FlgA [Acidiphilium sp.]MDD4935329.1 flagellar basal body P-ring formation chaperone FlgA [Acidiphilium sp.]
MNKPIICQIMLSSTLIFAALQHATAQGVPVQAAPSTRSLVSIDRPVVKLKDLFHHAGSEASTVLGPAPAPGSRIIIGAQQLAIIAKQYSVAWLSRKNDSSVVIERLGTPITKHQITQALRPALQRVGAANHIVVHIGDGQLPMVPLNSAPDISVNQIAYDRSNGNFSATILVTTPSMNPVSTTIAGFATRAVRAVVATHNLFAGEIMGSKDLKLAWIPQTTLPHGAIIDPSQAFGMQTTRAILMDAPLGSHAIASATLINRGATVSLAVDMPGLKVTAVGIALTAGAIGSIIPVMNPSSREIVQAVVDGPDHAHVIPGSMPTRDHNIVPYYSMAGNQP